MWAQSIEEMKGTNKKYSNRQTDGQKDKQTDRQTDRHNKGYFWDSHDQH